MLESRDSTGLKHILKNTIRGLVIRVLVHRPGKNKDSSKRLLKTNSSRRSCWTPGNASDPDPHSISFLDPDPGV
jgi:hypothetical protein